MTPPCEKEKHKKSWVIKKAWDIRNMETDRDFLTVLQCLMMSDSTLHVNTSPHIIQEYTAAPVLPWLFLFAMPVTYNKRSNNSQRVSQVITAAEGVSETHCPFHTLPETRPRLSVCKLNLSGMCDVHTQDLRMS